MRFALLLMLLVLIPAAAAQQISVSPGGIADAPHLKMYVESIDPKPVEPGQDLTIGVRLLNDGGESISGISVHLDAKHPFNYKTEVDSFEDITLCAGCSQDNTYYFTIDHDAITGMYAINFEIYKDGQKYQVFETKVDVHIRGKPNMVFHTESVSAAIPNSHFQSSLTVSNTGTGIAREIEIRPRSDKIIVLGSNIKTIKSLSPGETATVPLEFTTGENVEADVYHVPIHIKYKDEQGTEYSDEEELGVRVVNSGELNIESLKASSVDGSPVIQTGEPLNVIARVENIGYGDAEMIESDLECPMDGNKKAYVGKLEKDEDAPAVFRLIPRMQGHFVCVLATSYKDDTGSHTRYDEFDIYVDRNHKTAKIIWGIIAALLLAGAIFLYLRVQKWRNGEQ